VASEASVLLRNRDLAGEFDFTPPATAPADRTPPVATLALNPPPDLLFLARFDGSPLQQIGTGAPAVAGALDYTDARFGAGARVAGASRLAYPTAGNLSLDAGTIAFWARLPDRYPETSNGRQYLLAASAHADEGPIYTGTLALRRDLLGPNGAPQWNFWTTPESGAAGRDDLATPDTLGPGLHHFAITWDRARQSKALYLDGSLAVGSIGVELPSGIGATLDLGRWSPGANASGVTFDDLAIYGRALDPIEIARLAASADPVPASARWATSPELTVETKAIDDGGAIMSVQLGVGGVFGDPQPPEERYPLRLPEASGTYTVAARLFDRAGNSTTISTTITLAQPSLPIAHVEQLSDVGATLTFTPTNASAPPDEVQISATPDFAHAAWQRLPVRVPWLWPNGGPRAVWVRFRDLAGVVSATRAIGPDSRQLYLPIVERTNETLGRDSDEIQ
jgi:hypothetical protein